MYVLNVCYINILPILCAVENECDLRKNECNKNLNFPGHGDIISDMMLLRQELNDTEKKFDDLNHRRQVLSKVSELILNDVSSQITNIPTALIICCCCRTVPSAIFSEFLIFCNEQQNMRNEENICQYCTRQSSISTLSGKCLNYPTY